MISSQHPTSRSGFATVSEAADYLCVSDTTLRALLDGHELDGFLTAGGHRRVSWSSLRTYAGHDIAENDTTRQVAVYLRVSSESQNQAGSLERQKQYVIDETSKRNRIPTESILIFSDIGSSYSERKGLNRLVDAMLDGRVSKVVVQVEDRLSRIESTTSLLYHLAKRTNVTFEFLEDDDSDQDEITAAMAELLRHSTCISSRIHGKRGGEVVAKTLKPETIQRAIELRRQGTPIPKMPAILALEGHKTYNKRSGEEFPVSYWALKSQVFNGNEPILKSTLDANDTEFLEWFRNNCVVEGNTQTKCVDVYDRYRKYCKLRGYEVSKTNFHLGRCLKSIPRRQLQGLWHFIGVRFKDDKTATAKVKTTDGIGEYLSRFVVKGDEKDKITVKILWSHYLQWSKVNGLQPESQKLMGMRLKGIATRIAHSGSLGYYGLRFVG